MKCCPRYLPYPARKRCAAVRILGFAMLLLAFSRATNAAAQDKPAPNAQACGFSDTPYDTATDVLALEAYQDAVAQLLKQEQFSELDCLADAARAGKTRFSGGAWKLRQFYIGLDSPRPGHPTEEDWTGHLQLVERWRAQNPNSIAAPIVLAESYISYGWDARGDGSVEKVSESGWKLFAARLDRAKAILDEVAPAKCPDWYVAMLNVARGRSWELSQHYAIFNEAIAFEPGYQYFYRMLADYLQPKWAGGEGDPARFAEEQANRVAGDAGDVLYFFISEGIVCACQESEFAHFSWSRLQKGYSALEKQHGTSLVSLNSFALMASNVSDWETADSTFKRIGDSWSKDVWRTEEWFKQNRDIAAQAGPAFARAHAVRKEAEANMQTPEGQAYRRQVEKKLSTYEQACVKDSNGDAHKFEFFLQVGLGGTAQDGHTETKPDGFASCLMQTLLQWHTKKTTVLPPPPSPDYWLLLEVDPVNRAAVAK
jgi:hypothetical protein